MAMQTYKKCLYYFLMVLYIFSRYVIQKFIIIIFLCEKRVILYLFLFFFFSFSIHNPYKPILIKRKCPVYMYMHIYLNFYLNFTQWVKYLLRHLIANAF